MKQIIRNIPKGETDNFKLKNISYNNNHNLFLIFEDYLGKEMIICLNENEAKETIKFINQIEQ